MVDFMRLMTPEARARVEEWRAVAACRKQETEALSDENLVAKARYYMKQMQEIRYAPGEPVYDAEMWHVIIPELLRRLNR